MNPLDNQAHQIARKRDRDDQDAGVAKQGKLSSGHAVTAYDPNLIDVKVKGTNQILRWHRVDPADVK